MVENFIENCKKHKSFKKIIGSNEDLILSFTKNFNIYIDNNNISIDDENYCQIQEDLSNLIYKLLETLTNTYEKGYNQTLGGDGSLGRKHSEETKAKIRAKRKLQVISDETKKLWSKNRKGKPKPQSMRDKLKGNQNWMGTKAS
jgi:hypothetical protein